MTDAPAPPTFDDPAVAARLDGLTSQAIDALPFGVIRIGADDRVQFYSRTEAAQSGRGDRPTVGIDFFHTLAPCMDSPLVRGRIEQARAAGRLDVRLRHVGDFGDRGRELELRAVTAGDGGLWLLLRRT